MDRILVPTDFSDNALKAALYAAEIAVKSGATIDFIHVPQLGDERIYQPFPLHEKYNQLVTDNSTAALKQFVGTITNAYPSVRVTMSLQAGLPDDAIVEYCHHHPIDLIVMGTRGAGLLKEITIGTTTAQVIAKTTVPVLTVPNEYVVEEPDGLLLATSYFEQDTTVLNKVMHIARLFSAVVHVVVVEKEDAIKTNNTEQLQQYLTFLHQMFPDIVLKGELLEGSSLEGALERYCINNELDIIALITYPKTLLQKILRKSFTRRMSVHSRIPILAIPVQQQS